MNSHEFHDRPPVSTLVKETEKRKKGTIVGLIPGLVHALVRTWTLSFLKDTLVNWPARYIIHNFSNMPLGNAVRIASVQKFLFL